MLNFNNAEQTANTNIFVMPQLNSYYLTSALKRAGVEYEAYRYGEIKSGEAPLGTDEARTELINNFPALDADETPCIIVSRIAYKDMLMRANSLYFDPLSEEIEQYRAHAIERAIDERKDTARIEFANSEQYENCVADVLAQNSTVLRSWLSESLPGATAFIQTTLDPSLYERTGEDVVFRGYSLDPVLGCEVEWMGHAVVVEIVRAAPGINKFGFDISYVALDISSGLAWKTGKLVHAKTAHEAFIKGGE